ncbi:transporter substrate-binding domain-containing protein [Nocardioides sp. NPDC101246]|uniref:transporter substrate-binding domain-containing protein n=1 Tax=Nocardioides sp. NPDC101246 TaxID=3364336 RepID=UPI0038032349
MKLKLALVALAALPLALAGCGNASDTLSAAERGIGSDGSASAEPVAIPTQDVVSDVKADPALTERLPADVQKSKTLVLGTTEATGEQNLPHGGSDQSGAQIGLDIDLRNAIAAKLGVKWKTEFGSFETIVPGTQSGKYDVGQANFAVTSERLEVVDYATYLLDGQSFVSREDGDLDQVKTLTDICGHTVATSPGSSFQQILEDGAAECEKAGKKAYEVEYFKDNAAILLGLQNGKTDLYFGPTLSLKYLVSHQPGLKYLGELSLTDVGFVVAKKSPLAPVLVDAINALIADGTYNKIFTKWDVSDIKLDKSEFNPKPAF